MLHVLGSQPLKRVTEKRLKKGLLTEGWVGLRGLRSMEKHQRI